MKKYNWLIIGESESGDKYYALFADEPTDDTLTRLAFSWDGDYDNPDGQGFAGSYVSIEKMRLEVQ